MTAFGLGRAPVGSPPQPVQGSTHCFGPRPAVIFSPSGRVARWPGLGLGSRGDRRPVHGLLRGHGNCRLSFTVSRGGEPVVGRANAGGAVRGQRDTISTATSGETAQRGL